MKKEQFEFKELPYPTLARFGPVSYTHLPVKRLELSL